MGRRMFRILTTGPAPVGEIAFTPDREGSDAGTTEFLVAGPSGEAWMTLVRERVLDPGLVVLLPDGPSAQGPHDRDLRQLEAALALAARQWPLRIEGLAPPAPAGPDPAIESTLARLREALGSPLPRPVTDAAGLGRLLDELFDSGVRGDEARRRQLDAAADRMRGGDPSLESFARRWIRFRVEKPERLH